MEETKLSLEDLTLLYHQVPFFEDLTLRCLTQVISHIALRQHPPNQALLLEHDWGGSVYFILEGWVKIRTHNGDGKEITLNIVGKGEVIGEMAAIEEAPRSTDAITLTETRVCSIPAADFVALLESEPRAGIRLAQLIARRLRQVNRRLRLRDAESTIRVADTLLFLAEGQGRLTREGIYVPNLSHRELSNISGLARETVTRALNRLEKRGLINREPDQICIPDLGALEATIS
ncbi:MAG: Crp/Fnr family transcriptional regulator [Cyanobacteriota bacterium]|jgi:CRP/FNR family cyclic AMP-dependent transcriptional regulator